MGAGALLLRQRWLPLTLSRTLTLTPDQLLFYYLPFGLSLFYRLG